MKIRANRIQCSGDRLGIMFGSFIIKLCAILTDKLLEMYQNCGPFSR